MAFNSEMLVLARERKGFTQSELAGRARMSQSLISKFESAVKVPSDENVRALGDALEVPPGFFFQSGKRYDFGSSCTYHRRQSGIPASVLNRLLAEINSLRLHVSKLSISLDIDTFLSVPRLDMDDYDGDPEKVAREVRRLLGIPPGPIRNLTEVLESAGCVIQFMSFGTRKLSAMSQWFPPSLPVFLVNADSPVDHQRFTMAHELGHLVMHEAMGPDMEDEADRFASEFLMPSDEIGPLLGRLTERNLHILKLSWRVSMVALIRKAKRVKKINDSQYKSLMIQLSRRGYRKREPDVLFPEEPTFLNRILSVYLEELDFSTDDLASLLNELPEVTCRRYQIGKPTLRLA